MPELKFTLTHDRKYYRDLFHHEDFNFLARNTKLRMSVHILCAFILFTLIARGASYLLPSVGFLVPLGTIGILGAFATGFQGLLKYFSWKFYVNRYSRKLSAHETTILRISSKGLKVKAGKNENTYEWEFFDLTKISDDYIILTNKETTSLVIPSECLSISEFRNLNIAIRRHLKQVQ